MKQKTFLIICLILSVGVLACGEKDTLPPRVVKTFPVNGSTDVDPSITEISVTFNEEMMDGSYSWAYEDKNTFPQMTGQPFYDKSLTKNTLPVKLEANKEYVIWLNTEELKYFKDKSGNPLVPFKFTFKTK